MAVCGGDHRQSVGTMRVPTADRHRMDRQVLGASGPLGRVWDRDKVDGRNEAGLEWAELCPVVKFRSVCLSGILL